MRQTKKAASLLLSVVFLAISVCIPLSVAAEDTYTIKKEGTLTRFELAETATAFAAEETKSFSFTVDTTAEYALYMNSQDNNKVGTVTTFSITQEGGTPVSFTVRASETNNSNMTQVTEYAYTHPSRYNNTEGFTLEKVGGISELRATLTAGTQYTLNVYREQPLTKLNYIDLKCLTLPITGGKQAISSEDTTKFTTTTAAHITEQLNYGNDPLPEGYKLIGDYTDDTIFASTQDYPRYIHITKGSSAEYTLDVQKAGWYRITYRTCTWVDTKTVVEGNNYSFSVPLSVDGELKDTLLWSFTATQDGQSVESLDLRALPIYFDEGIHTLKFGNATEGSYAYHILLEELVGYDPSAVETVQMNTVPVQVDSTLARFELDTPISIASTSNKYAFSFTPVADGEYAFFLDNTGSATQPVNITVSDGTDAVFNTTYTTIGRPYERFGDNKYYAASLKAGTTYTITLSGEESAVTIAYFDVRCVNPLKTPAEGKFSVSPSDYVVTSIGGAHMSQQFAQQQYKNTDYPMIGDYFSEQLKSPRDRATAVHLGDAAYVTYALDVTTPGYYTLTLPSVTTYPGDAGAESVRLSVNGETYDEQGWVGTATDLVFKPVYLYEGVNRITLTNLTVPYADKNGSSVGSYIKTLLFDQEAAEPEPTEISADTKVDSKIPLNSMIASEGDFTRDDETGGYFLTAGDSLTYEINVQEKGTYVVYIDGQAAQLGVDVLIDDVSRLGATYKTTGQKETVTASFGSRQVKKLSYPVELEPGEHTIKLVYQNGYKWDESLNESKGGAALMTDEDGYISKLYSVWMRRTDLTASESEEMFLRSWDFSSVSFLNEEAGTSSSAGWAFPHQYNQGGPFTVGPFTDCRSVVFINGTTVTYRINIPVDGNYSMSAFIMNPSSSTTDMTGVANTITMQIGSNQYTKDHVSDGNSTMDPADKLTFDPVFLTKGTYDVTFKAPASPTGTLRLYGVSVAKDSADFVAVSQNSATVSVTFDKAYTGSVITAFYGANNELVGVKTAQISDADHYTGQIDLAGEATSAKVLVWEDMVNVKPLRASIDFAKGAAGWIEG